MTSMRNKVIEGIMESDIFSFSHTFTEDDVIQFADTPMGFLREACLPQFEVKWGSSPHKWTLDSKSLSTLEIQ